MLMQSQKPSFFPKLALFVKELQKPEYVNLFEQMEDDIRLNYEIIKFSKDWEARKTPR